MASVETASFLPGVDDRRLFNAANEIARAQEVLREHLAPQAVLGWVRHQVEGFLAEFGFGESLSVQPPYWLEIARVEDSLQVYSFNLSEYGEQSASYFDAEGFPLQIGEGLHRAYSLLATSKEGEGVIIMSPSEFYQDYGSRYDVANVFRVAKEGPNGRLVEGRYYLLNGRLTSSERAFVLNWHNSGASIPTDAGAGTIVRSPQLFRFSERALAAEDPLVAHAQSIRRAFAHQFGRELLGGESNLDLYRTIRELVDEHLSSLNRAVIGKDEQGVLRKLKNMLIRSQRVWAHEQGIDPELHIDDITSGRLLLGGIHPVTGLPVRDGSVFDSEPCGAETKRCAEHGDYEGEECPVCKSLQS